MMHQVVPTLAEGISSNPYLIRDEKRLTDSQLMLYICFLSFTLSWFRTSSAISRRISSSWFFKSWIS